MKKLLMILGILCLSNALFAQANDVAWWEPAEPEPGDSITIFYDDVKGTLPDNGQLTVKLHWGINEDRPGNWKQPPTIFGQ